MEFGMEPCPDAPGERGASRVPVPNRFPEPQLRGNLCASHAPAAPNASRGIR